MKLIFFIAVFFLSQTKVIYAEVKTKLLLINKSNRLISKKSKPNLIIANTIKGKGVSFMENKFESHYQVLSKKDYRQSLEQLSKGFSKSI